jgi:hypothetical protein
MTPIIQIPMTQDSVHSTKGLSMEIDRNDELNLFVFLNNINQTAIDKIRKKPPVDIAVISSEYIKFLLLKIGSNICGITMFRSEHEYLQQIENDCLCLNIVDRPAKRIVARIKVKMQQGFAKQINELLVEDDNCLYNLGAILSRKYKDAAEFIGTHPFDEIFDVAQYHFNSIKEA